MAGFKIVVASLLSPVISQHVTMEQPTSLPPGWTVGESTPSGRTIELLFAVKQQHVNELHDKLMSVSTPSSPSYGMHLSNEEVNQLVAPDAAHIQAVKNFLTQHGVEGQHATPNGDLIRAIVPVEIAETMLSTTYTRLVHSASGVSLDRTVGGYSLPAAVAAAIDFVSPTTHIPGVRSKGSNISEVGASFGNVNVPKTLRELYSVGDVVGKASSNKQAVTAFLKQMYDEKSLKQFWDQYCTKESLTCGKGLPKLVGDATTGEPGMESMLDIETITGVGGNIETEFWGFSGSPPESPENEPFMKWIGQVSSTGDADVPKLFSTSYGEPETTWPIASAQRLNTEFMKMGTRGITLLFASGDNGAGCKSGKFHPNTPASSPFVTAVGGTQPGDGFPKPGSETAIGLSAGGFSDYFGMPEYQKDAVADYVKNPSVPSASKVGYNASGRAFPDISAQATNFCVTPFGCDVAGTSCASPTAAGIFGLLNDLRIQSGKPTLGFLNPLLYANPAALNDVTSGSSSGCLFQSGWPAVKGWDAVTGLGTPNYEKLAKVVMGSAASAPDANVVVV